MDKPSNDETRAILDQVLARAHEDDEYRAALLEDPVGSLTAAGLSVEDASAAAAHGLELEHEVVGFMMPDCGGGVTYVCDTITCVITVCADVPNTNRRPRCLYTWP